MCVRDHNCWARDPFFSQPLSACVITVDSVVCVCVLVNAIAHWTMGNLKTQALPHLVLSPESLLRSKCPIICMSNKALKNMNFNYHLLYPISSFKVLPLPNRNTLRCYSWWDLIPSSSAHRTSPPNICLLLASLYNVLAVARRQRWHCSQDRYEGSLLGGLVEMGNLHALSLTFSCALSFPLPLLPNPPTLARCNNDVLNKRGAESGCFFLKWRIENKRSEHPPNLI